jgi:hypothetical protein
MLSSPAVTKIKPYIYRVPEGRNLGSFSWLNISKNPIGVESDNTATFISTKISRPPTYRSSRSLTYGVISQKFFDVIINLPVLHRMSAAAFF